MSKFGPIKNFVFVMSSKLLSKRVSSFDLQKHHVHFHSIYHNEEMKLSFLKHLESEFNTEPFEFCLLVEEFETKKLGEEKLKLFFVIYETFLKNNSDKEINLSGEIKQLFNQKNSEQLESNDKWISKDEENIFSSIRVSIENQLYHDVFPRFIRTMNCIKVLEKHSRDSKVLELKQIYDFPYKDSDFESEIVTDNDIAFLDRLMEDSYDWDLVYSENKSHTNTFLLKKSYLPDVSFFKDSKVYKFESMIPFSLEQCIEGLCSINQLKKYDDVVDEGILVSYLSPEEGMKKYPDAIKMKRANAVIDMRIKLPMAKFRRPLDVATTYFDKDGSWIRIVVPKIPDFIKDPSDWGKCHKGTYDGKKIEFYGAPNIMRFQLTKISENLTKYTHINSFHNFLF
jgi:hypothetical protein